MAKLAFLIVEDQAEKVDSAAQLLLDEGYRLLKHNSSEAESLIKQNLSEVGFWIRNTPMLDAERLISYVHLQCVKATPIILLSSKHISYRKKSTWIDLGNPDRDATSDDKDSDDSSQSLQAYHSPETKTLFE